MKHFTAMLDEMRRLQGLLIKSNRRYEEREAYVREKHKTGAQNFSGSIETVLNNDLLLSNLSGTSKTLSIIGGGLAQMILAELAVKEAARGRRDAAG